MADIDFLKRYNDTYGHQAGDKCLQKVALAINQTVQITTTTQPKNQSLVGRYGGEEFAIVLPNRTLTDAVSIAEKIRSQVKSLKIIHQGFYIS